MTLLCRLGRHRCQRMSAPDRVDRLGRANPRHDKCRRCGHERDVPLENSDNPSPPFVGG
jgi:hypothetical protein